MVEASIGAGAIAARAAVNDVRPAVVREQAIAARVAAKGVPAASSDEDVVAARSLQEILPRSAALSVVPPTAVDGVVAIPTRDEVVAATAEEEVVPHVPNEDVVSRASVGTFDVHPDGISLAGPSVVPTTIEVDADGIRPSGVVDDVRAPSAAERIGAASAVENVEITRASSHRVISDTAREEIWITTTPYRVVTRAAHGVNRRLANACGDHDIIEIAQDNANSVTPEAGHVASFRSIEAQRAPAVIIAPDPRRRFARRLRDHCDVRLPRADLVEHGADGESLIFLSDGRLDHANGRAHRRS